MPGFPSGVGVMRRVPLSTNRASLAGRRTTSSWRAFVGGVLVAVALLLTSGVASAHYVYAGFNYYWTGQDGGGTIWCAANDGSISEYGGYSSLALIDGYTQTDKYVYCSTHATAPAGYIAVSSRMLRSDGAVCINWAANVTYNADGSYYAYEPRGWFLRCWGAGYFKTQIYSGAALVFSWRYNLTESGTHYFS